MSHGNMVANYTLVRQLGHGGMAEVFEAIDTRNQLPVALKLLLPHLAVEDVIRKRFLREAGVGMELDHPGIVKVYDVGEDRGRPYLAMELVKGKTLEDLLKTTGFDLKQCLGIALKITDALAAAHTKKIVHRDIKPRNIMVTDTGIKIMDFGLARILETSSITDQHEIVGTLYYMSPEQAIGIKVDESSDVFSLGVVLYQMLTGHLPFVGEHPGAIIHAILYSDPLRINELGKQVPLELEQILFKSLKKKSQARYRTAADLHADLSKMHGVLQGQTIQLLATEEVFEESPRGIYSRLVGREKEMAMLEATLEKMMQGESSVVLVSGEAGIGKSRLVWELGRKARERHARYLLGRCLFGERGYPYQPIIEVLRDYFKFKGIKDQDAVDAYIEEKISHLSARKEIIHSLILLQSGQPITLINKEQLWDTVSELIKVIVQDRPVVLHLDDLHWADAPTLNLLTYLAMAVRNERLMVVATYRPEELTTAEGSRHPLEKTLELLGKEHLSQELRLSRLNKQATHAVVDSVFADSTFPDNFYDSVHQETEGNPLFVLEVLKYLQDERIVNKDDTGWHLTGDLTKLAIPDRVTDVIMHRLAKLTPETRAVLDVAAVEGYTFQSEAISSVLGEPRLRILRRLQHLESEHHLIHALEKEYQFDHGKIQETVYNSLLPELKIEYHRLLSDHFIQHWGEQDEYAGKISHHLIASHQEEKSLPYLLRAGQHATKLYANNTANTYYELGLSITNTLSEVNNTRQIDYMKMDFLKGSGMVKEILGRHKKAREDYEHLLQLARVLKIDKEYIYGLHRIGETFHATGSYKLALTYYNKAITMSTAHGDKKTTAKCLTSIGMVYEYKGEYRKSLYYFNQALRMRYNMNDEHGIYGTMGNIGILYGIKGNYSVALKYLKKVLRGFTKIRDRHALSSTLCNIGCIYQHLGQNNRALANFHRALSFKQQVGDKTDQSAILIDIFISYCNKGAYEVAFPYLKQALQITILSENIYREAVVRYNMGLHHEILGKYQTALTFLERSLEIRTKIGDRRGMWESLNGLSNFWLSIGDIVKAKKFYKKSLRIAQKLATNPIRSKTHRLMANIAICTGSIDTARSEIQNALKVAKSARDYGYICDSLNAATNIEILRNKINKAHKFANTLLGMIRKDDYSRMATAHYHLAQIWLQKNIMKKSVFHARNAKKILTRCGIIENLWQAHHLLAKVYMTQKKQKQVNTEINKAKEVLDVIISNLGDELKEIYLRRKEVKEFMKDLRGIGCKSKKGRRK